MISDLKDVIARSEPTLLQDAIGAVALMFMLFAGLHLPAFV